MQNIKKDYALIHGEEFYVENHDPKGILIEKAKEMLEETGGPVEYIGYWFVKDCLGYVFHCLSPIREKGHKDYVILKHRYNAYIEGYDLVIMGYDKNEMEKMSHQGVLLCNHCKTAIWSAYRHDFHYCRCLPENFDKLSEEEQKTCKQKAIFIDGGMDYTRSGYGKESSYISGSINHLTKQINVIKRRKK